MRSEVLGEGRSWSGFPCCAGSFSRSCAEGSAREAHRVDWSEVRAPVAGDAVLWRMVGSRDAITSGSTRSPSTSAATKSRWFSRRATARRPRDTAAQVLPAALELLGSALACVRATGEVAERVTARSCSRRSAAGAAECRALLLRGPLGRGWPVHTDTAPPAAPGIDPAPSVPEWPPRRPRTGSPALAQLALHCCSGAFTVGGSAWQSLGVPNVSACPA
jgi:hypothetical protein